MALIEKFIRYVIKVLKMTILKKKKKKNGSILDLD